MLEIFIELGINEPCLCENSTELMFKGLKGQNKSQLQPVDENLIA